MNISTHMVRAGNAFKDHPAIAVGTTILSNYGELARRVSCLATALRENFNLTNGDRVALIAHNCPEYIELLYACWHAGLVVVPINAKLHQSDFSYILENSGTKLCFTSPDLANSLNSLRGNELKTVIDVSGDDYTRMLACNPMRMISRAPEDMAWLFYTSGTTGQPKGAVLSHRNLLAMCQCYFADVDQGAPWQTFLHAAPMSHGSGLYGLAHVMQASCHIIPESGGFDAAEVYALIENWPGLTFFAAPTMVKRLLDHPGDTDTSNLKTIIYGGGPMYVEDCLAGLKRFGPKLAQLYGQGESPMTITALSSYMHANKDHPRWRDRLASVGIAQSAVEVRIANSRGTLLPSGEIGEVLVRGDTVMSGYWRNPEASAEALRDGWLHTGDYGVLDEDGFLTLKDRSKDVIISGGTNIYPREVEEVIIMHPDVREVSVIGRTDREWGESVVAFVVPRSGLAVDITSLEQFCLKNMARFKRPKHYRFIEKMPKNNYGKVLKTTLRELDQAGGDIHPR
ncbi:MAG: AMP-dependent synthetase [Alphaproteobacteria bacterium]|nr:MAG: AMP-dependent synthetase [Alphaproteobacteria bacterium]